MQRQGGLFETNEELGTQLVMRSSKDSNFKIDLNLGDNEAELKPHYSFKIKLIQKSQAGPRNFKIRLESCNRALKFYEVVSASNPKAARRIESYRIIEFLLNEKNKQYISYPPEEEYFKIQNFLYFYREPDAQIPRHPPLLRNPICDRTQIIDLSDVRFKEDRQTMKRLIFSDDEDDEIEIAKYKPRIILDTPSPERRAGEADRNGMSEEESPERKSEIQEVRRYYNRVIDDTVYSSISETQRPVLSSDSEEEKEPNSSESSDYVFQEEKKSDTSLIIQEVLNNRTPRTVRRNQDFGSRITVIEHTPQPIQRKPAHLINTIETDEEDEIEQEDTPPPRRNLNFARLEESKISALEDENDEDILAQAMRVTTVAAYKRAERRSERKMQAMRKETERKEEEKNEEEKKQEICTICMGEIESPARPATCSHLFCLDCLKNWSLQTNICPLCRKEFRGIIMHSGEKALSVAKQKFRVPEEYYEEDVVPFLNEVCMYCQDDDDEEDLMICDECGTHLAHSFCVGLPEVPEGEWFCQFCRPLSYTESNRYMSDEEREEEGGRQESIPEVIEEESEEEADQSEVEIDRNHRVDQLYREAMFLFNRTRDLAAMRGERSSGGLLISRESLRRLRSIFESLL